jgi:hypothetical protein
MKAHSNAPMKQAWNSHAVVDLSEPRDLIRFCTLVTIGALVSSLVIGACWGRLDYILASLAIAGVISLIFWAITLLAVTLISIPDITLRLCRRLARGLSANRGAGGGVADEWLDGPS